MEKITSKPVIFIKIGGSLITDKNKPFSLRNEALDLIAKEIRRAAKTEKLLIVGHGAGSFAHVPAKKYQTIKGVLGKDSYRGMVEVADAAARLNRVVVSKLLEERVNAVSISPLSMMTARAGKLQVMAGESLESLLKNKVLPVVYGDLIMDSKTGCTIFSTEKVLGYIALYLKKKGYRVERMIHCGQTNGVYDEDGKTIEVINRKNMGRYEKVLGGSGGVDVTGGMKHKVEEALQLAKKGIPGLIIDGVVNGSLAQAVKGEKVLGTRIEW